MMLGKDLIRTRDEPSGMDREGRCAGLELGINNASGQTGLQAGTQQAGSDLSLENGNKSGKLSPFNSSTSNVYSLAQPVVVSLSTSLAFGSTCQRSTDEADGLCTWRAFANLDEQ
jgi:hypothetical protein